MTAFFERFTFNPLIKRRDETDFESSPDDDDGTLAVVGLPDNKYCGKEDGTCGETEDGESRLCGTVHRRLSTGAGGTRRQLGAHH
jgi:hypothetical protein